MALVDADSNGASRGNPSGAKETTGPRIRLKHVDGYDPNRTGRPEATLARPGGEEVKLRREHSVSRELVNKYKVDLQKELEGLIKDREDFKNDAQGLNEFKQYLTESGHSYFIPLWNKLIQEQHGTGDRNWSIDKKALDDLLKTNRGLALAYQIRQYKVQEVAMAFARTASLGLNEPGDRTGRVRESVQRGEMGPIREAVRSVWAWGGERTGTPDGREAQLRIRKGVVTMVIAGSVVLLGPVGAVIGGPLGIAIAGAGLLPGGFAGLAHLSRSGVDINLDLSKIAWQGVVGDPDSPTKSSTNPAELKWLKRHHYLDPTDYVIGPNGLPQVNVRKVAETTRNKEDLRNDLMGHLNDLDEFQNDDGIRSEYRRPLDMDWLIADGIPRGPQQGTPFEALVMREFNANRGGVLDRNGNAIEVRVLNTAGVPYTDPAGNEVWQDNTRLQIRVWNTALGDYEFRPNPNRFNPGNRDRAGDIMRWRKATEKVLGIEASNIFEHMIHGGHNYDAELITMIEGMQKGKGNGEHKAKLEKQGNAEKTALAGDKASLREEVKKVADFEAEVAKLQKSLAEAEREQQKAANKVSIVGVPTPTIAQVQEALSKVLGDTPGSTVVIGGQSIESIGKEYEDLETKIKTEVGDYETAHVNPILGLVAAAETDLRTAQVALTTARAGGVAAVIDAAQQDVLNAQAILSDRRQKEATARDDLRKKADSVRESSWVKRAESRIEQRTEVIMKALDALQTTGEAIVTAEDALFQDEIAGQKEANAFHTGLPGARNAVESFENLAGSKVITRANLETMSLEQLLPLINAGYPGNGCWPEGENNSPERRLQVLHAMAEARAGRIAPMDINTPPAMFNDVLDASVWNFSEGEILTLSTAQIRELMNQRSAMLGLAILTDAAIDNVRSIAERRVTARRRAMDGIISQLGIREGEIEKDLGRIAEQGLLTPQLDTIKHIAEGYGHRIRLRMSTDAIFTLEQLGDFLSETKASDATVKDRYSTEEQKHGTGLLNIVDAVTGYRTDNIKGKGYESETTEEGIKRSLDVVSTDLIRDLLVEEFALPNFPGPPPRLPTVDEAIALLRYRFSLTTTVTDPSILAAAPQDLTMEKDLDRLGRIFSEKLIHEHLKAKVPVAQ